MKTIDNLHFYTEKSRTKTLKVLEKNRTKISNYLRNLTMLVQ